MRTKVAALAHLDRLDEARAELGRVLAIDPKLTIAGFREYAHFMAPEVLELHVAGLRLAGQREYPRAAQSAGGGDRSHRTGAPFEPVRSV